MGEKNNDVFNTEIIIQEVNVHWDKWFMQCSIMIAIQKCQYFIIECNAVVGGTLRQWISQFLLKLSQPLDYL